LLSTFLSSILVLAPTCIAQGRATHYHDWYEGRQTASGEVFLQSVPTIAVGFDLAINRYYTLTDLDTGASIRVWANDYGSEVPVADMSNATAIQLLGHVDNVYNACLKY
jgi:rare lipoprotein A (peptidoglycan hydrolase)